MARVCFLCGGPLRDGKCTECGLDNTKNDKRYQLNTHNDSGAHFHDGDCEDGLNKERKKRKPRKKKKNQEKQETFNYSELLEKEKKKVRSGGGRKKDSSGKSASSSGQPAGKKKKKKGGIFWIVLVCLASILVDGVSEDWDNVQDFVKNLGSYWEDALDSREISFVWEDDAEEEAVSEEVLDDDEWRDYIGGADGEDLPEQIQYDENSPLYVEMLLDQGIYTVGYDIPEGTYQFHIEDEGYGTATVTWCGGDKLGDYFCLYSADAGEDYAEYMETDCPYGEYSRELFLEDGDEIYIESVSGAGLYLYGLAEGDSGLQEREPQKGLEEVLLENEEVMTAGVDFEPGVYDITLESENTYSFIYVTLTSEKGLFSGLCQECSSSLDANRSVCYRIPLEEGTEIYPEYAEEGEMIRLVPSY